MPARRSLLVAAPMWCQGLEGTHLPLDGEISKIHTAGAVLPHVGSQGPSRRRAPPGADTGAHESVREAQPLVPVAGRRQVSAGQGRAGACWVVLIWVVC